MTLFTVGVLLLFGRSFAAYGLAFWRRKGDVTMGLLWGFVLVSGAGMLRLLGVRHEPGVQPPTMVEGVIYASACLLAVLLFAWFLQRRTFLCHVPIAVSLLLLLGVMCAPLVVALRYGRPFGHTLLTVLWLVFGAGFGEEIFYRGYIQSRLNAAFGRPFCVLKIQFGAGLLISSLLFGLLHAPNSIDYFEGRFSFAWGFGIANICTGLFYGCLREVTGGVLAGAVTHGTLDVLVIIPSLISAR
jgi:membrane protease YdiL (CAAX protease family)